MSSRSEVKWSDKHHRYFQHVIDDNGSVLDTIWLDSADRIEAEDEATEQRTIPTHPAGGPRLPQDDTVIHPDTSNPYAPQPSKASGGGMYLPTQPDYQFQPLSGGSEFAGEVRPLRPQDLPPVQPPPQFPASAYGHSRPNAAYTFGTQASSSAARITSSHYEHVFDDTYHVYKCLRYDYATAEWLFDHWMDPKWKPPMQMSLSSPTDQNPNFSSLAMYGHSPSYSGAYGSSYNTSRAIHDAAPSITYTNASSGPVTPDTRLMPKGEGPAIRGTYGGPSTAHYEELDRSYFVRDRSFFFEGRVFSIIMSESAGDGRRGITDYTTSSSITEVKFKGNFVYTNARRFVVVRKKREFCYACPISTYSGRATTKTGVRANEHGIVYSWGESPQLLPGEGGITKPSLSVVMAKGIPHLDKACRIYYGIIHPIQYNVKVKDIGYIPKDQVHLLIGSWREEDDKDTEPEAYVTANADIPELDSPGEEGDDVFEEVSEDVEQVTGKLDETNM